MTRDLGLDTTTDLDTEIVKAFVGTLHHLVPTEDGRDGWMLGIQPATPDDWNTTLEALSLLPTLPPIEVTNREEAPLPPLV